MDKNELKKKCSEYMGRDINPEDLNELAEVVDKLSKEYQSGDFSTCGDSEINGLLKDFLNVPIKQALRDFITETLRHYTT